jgi:hypothetical protein
MCPSIASPKDHRPRSRRASRAHGDLSAYLILKYQ